MCSYDDDPATIWNDCVRKARKQHGCSACPRTIEVGETYRYATWLYDGYWSTAKVCNHCFAAGQWVVKVCGYHPWVNLDEGFKSLSMGRLIRLRERGWKRAGQLVALELVEAIVADALRRVPELARV